jgi:hypothetical protein
MDIRLLKASEIECRVGTMKSDGCSLLLYKDARVDMRLLDETFGAMNWKRSHEVIDGNLYCTISIWDESKKEWISKQDVGTESMTEKEKGQASDSFKRAGFNWNIGRELYTAPFIWIKLDASEVNTRNGKPSTYTKFLVKEIGYNEHREINKLVISDEKGKVRYSMGGTAKVEQPKPKESDEDDLIQIAYSDISRAKDVATLQNVWSEYKSLQSNKNFVNAVTAKKTSILNGL